MPVVLPTPDHDPLQWLEAIETAVALDWVKARNAATLARLGGPALDADRAAVNAILTSGSGSNGTESRVQPFSARQGDLSAASGSPLLSQYRPSKERCRNWSAMGHGTNPLSRESVEPLGSAW